MNNLRNLFSLAGFKTALKHVETTNQKSSPVISPLFVVCPFYMFPLYITTVTVEITRTPPWNRRRGTDQKPRERVYLASWCCTLSTILSEYQHHRSENSDWVKYGNSYRFWMVLTHPHIIPYPNILEWSFDCQVSSPPHVCHSYDPQPSTGSWQALGCPSLI